MVDVQLLLLNEHRNEINSVALLKRVPFSMLELQKCMEGRASELLACPLAAGELLPEGMGTVAMEWSGLERRDTIPSRTRGNNEKTDAGIGYANTQMMSGAFESVFMKCSLCFPRSHSFTTYWAPPRDTVWTRNCGACSDENNSATVRRKLTFYIIELVLKTGFRKEELAHEFPQ